MHSSGEDETNNPKRDGPIGNIAVHPPNTARPEREIEDPVHLRFDDSRIDIGAVILILRAVL